MIPSTIDGKPFVLVKALNALNAGDQTACEGCHFLNPDNRHCDIDYKSLPTVECFGAMVFVENIPEALAKHALHILETP